MSTSCPRRLGPGSDGPRGRPAVTGDSGPGLRDCGVDQLSCATRARVRGPAVLTNSYGRFIFWPLCGVRQSWPSVPHCLGPGPRARGVDQLPRVTWAWVRGAAVSTRFPRRLARGSVGPGVDLLSRATRAWSKGLPVRPTVPGDSGPGPRVRGVDQLSRATCARVRGLAVSTSSPRRLELGSEACRVDQMTWATRARV